MKEFEDKKEEKRKRKIAQLQDRSKYKKSVHKKHAEQREREQEERSSDHPLKRGQIVHIFSEHMGVYSEGTLFTCTLRGLLKKEYLRTKNLVVVGDYVLFAPEENRGIIWQVEKRKSVLAKASKHREQEQLIAANLDQVILVTSTDETLFNLPYLDRAMIATYRGSMRPLLVVNKVDLGISPAIQEAIALYETLEIPIITTSTKSGAGMERLKEAMKDKASVFAGLSGVGKSSLINYIAGTHFATQELSEKVQRGRHTTTRSSLLHLDFGGLCIDTPDIQNFGLLELSKEEIDRYFSEITAVSAHCKFYNCTHTHEPGCAVKEACEQGKLSKLRLLSYQALLN